MRRFLAAHGPGRAWARERAAQLVRPTVSPQTWCAGAALLAAAPLPARAHEPPWSPVTADDGRLVLTGYVRLDDRPRLLGRVAGARARWCDEALLLHAWAAHGPAVLEDVVGVFAFAVWDGRAGRLTAVRDQLGLQPLYWAPWQGGHVVASDPAALTGLPGVDATVDPVVVAATTLRLTPVVRERSLHVGVRKVPPGCLLELQGDAAHRRRYWATAARPVRRSAVEVVDELRPLLVEAVRAAVQDGPVGAHVSGGLDSSTVAAVAQDQLRRQHRSLTAAFTWSPAPATLAMLGPDDERHRLQRFVDGLGVPLVYSSFDGDRLAESMRAALTPGGVGGLVHEPALLDAAADRGIRVLLSGWGGDEVVSWNGRGALPGLLADGRLLSAVRASLVSARARPGRRPPAARAARALALAAATLRPNRLHRRTSPVSLMWAADVRRRGDALPPAVLRAQRLSQAPAGRAVGVARTQVAAIENGHLSERAESWAHAGAAAGVEYRYPLLDRRIVELVLSVPDDVHAAAHGRWLLTASCQGWLPDDIRLGSAKSEPAKWRHQVAVMAAQPPVRPVGDAEAADVFERWAAGRREVYRGYAAADARTAAESAGAAPTI